MIASKLQAPSSKLQRSSKFQVPSKVVLGFGAWILFGAFGPPASALGNGALGDSLPRTSPTEPTNALASFQVRPGFRLEVAAAEPLIADPIAMSFDGNGRLYVIEMRDYSERRNERLGRVRLLEDADGDGRFEQSTIFADDLPWPTAVTCYDGGVFVGATPDILFLKDTSGDQKADLRHVIFTGFAEGQDRLNVQGLMNSFQWGLDNRIHGATGLNGARMRCALEPGGKVLELRGRDFSFDPRHPQDFRAESGGGQHGLTFTDDGRKLVCHNSAHIKLVMYDERYAARNSLYSMPPVLLDIAEDGAAAEVYRISPEEPWRVLRTAWRVAGKVSGPIEGGGRASGYFTSATGITIYRGDAFPESFRGDAFIADVGSNLIHRKKLYPAGVSMTARRAADEQKSEFLASKDLWFRPVQFANAPDGCLYFADMYREVVEHPWSIPESIKEQLDLNSGNDRGRIYRIIPENFQRRKFVKLNQAGTAELVAQLENLNGWHRDTAARLLYQRQDAAATPYLETLFKTSRSPIARLHALYALKNPPLVKALSDPDHRVREHAIRMAEGHTNLVDKLLSMAGDPAPRVRYQLAFTLGQFDHPKKTDAFAALLRADPSSPWLHAAVLSSLKEEAITLLKAAPAEFQKALLYQVGARDRRAEIEQAMAVVKDDLVLAAALAEGLDRAKSSFQNSELLSRAAKVANQAGAPEAQRVAAVRLLGLSADRQTLPALLGVFNGSAPEPVQRAAMASLRKFPGANVASNIVAQWPSLTPLLRAEALSLLLARPERARVLLNAVSSGIIQRAELSSTQIGFLTSHNEQSIRELAEQNLGNETTSKRQEIIDQLTPALALTGDPAKGRQIFSERCASCHRLGDEGHALGPDLVTVKTAGKEKLLLNIVDPNREVLPNYVSYLVETKTGDSYIGLVTETGADVIIREAFGRETKIPRPTVKRIATQSQSLMPEGLEAGLIPQSMADLLEYLTR